jgi:hypothetical protein
MTVNIRVAVPIPSLACPLISGALPRQSRRLTNTGPTYADFEGLSAVVRLL